MCVCVNALRDVFIYPDEEPHEISQNLLQFSGLYDKEILLLVVCCRVKLKDRLRVPVCICLCHCEPVYVFFFSPHETLTAALTESDMTK